MNIIQWVSKKLGRVDVNEDNPLPVTGAWIDEVAGKAVVGNCKSKGRNNFTDLDDWDVSVVGGITYALVKGTNGVSYLKVVTGTGANDKLQLLSKKSFRFPVLFGLACTLSQRIANQDVFIDLVAVDPTTGAVIEDSIGPKNFVGWRITGSDTTSQGRYRTRGDSDPTDGGSLYESAATTFATSWATASGTDPNFSAPYQLEIIPKLDRCQFRVLGANGTSQASSVFGRTDALPDPELIYKVRVIVLNGGTPPASSTDVRFHFWRLADYTRLIVEPANLGATDGGVGAPVVVANTANVALSSAGPSTPTTDTSTALGAGATFTGSSRDGGSTPVNRSFHANFYADQASAANGARIEKSQDGTTWRPAASATLDAGVPAELSVACTARYYRCIMVNGATAQGACLVTSAYHKT